MEPEDSVLKFLVKESELSEDCRVLKEDECLWDLAFLIGIMGHLNNLNLRLHENMLSFPTCSIIYRH